MKEVSRRCVSCKKIDNKKNFLRIVKTKDNFIFIDNDYKIFGRSAYICKNVDCIKKAFLKKRLEKALRIKNISKNLKEELKKNLLKYIEEVINEKV